MTAEWDEKSVFLAALELSGEEREAFLRDACPDDAARERIEALLRHHDAVTREILNAVPPAEPESPGDALTRVAEFQIVRRLGQGGMGVVYLAEDLILGRKVALKILSPGLTGSEEALARFRAEARSTAAIKHPAIVPIYKFGSDGTTHYIASEYVEGPTLTQVISDERQQRRDQAGTATQKTWYRKAAETVAVIAEALEAAHRQRIIHRDVKPSNILLDNDQGPRLTDFGIAKHLAEETHGKGTTLIGTCHYMSPEQASIAKTTVDERSDVFSLGVVLYELITLRRPFDGADPAQILRAVMERIPPRLRSVDKRVPGDLETICLKAIEKRPADRYQSAAHLAADLRSFLEDRPILAVPPSVSRRARCWVRTHQKTTMGLICALLLALTVGTVSYAMVRETRHWQSQRSAIDLSAVDERTSVLLRHVDAATFELGARKPVEWPQDSMLWLLPGQYRLEFVDPDGRFAELDLALFEPGQRHALAPILRHGDEVTASMILVPAGELDYRGLGGHADATARIVHMEAFWIDRYEVSHREYLDFLEGTGHPRPRSWGEEWPSDEFAGFPVIGITWQDMQTYARWAGKRLPTALEWEYAARWPDNRLLPWEGAAPDGYRWATSRHRELMNSTQSERHLTVYTELASAVDADPLPNPLGMHFTFGNVAEMTATVTLGQMTRAVLVKGGTWLDHPSQNNLTGSRSLPLEAASMIVGFRCARGVAPDAAIIERR